MDTNPGSINQAAAGAPPSMDSADWNRRYAGTDFIWTVDANRFLISEMVGKATGRALDLASGEGRNAVWLAEQGWQVHAVDFSDVGIFKGRQLAQARQVLERIEFEVADLRDYRIARQYDLVTLLYLQIPQHELVPILKRAACAVAPGGTLLVIGHDSANLTQGYGGPQHPEVLYTADQVVAALDAELTIEKAWRVARPVPTGTGVKSALDCLVRARRA